MGVSIKISDSSEDVVHFSYNGFLNLVCFFYSLSNTSFTVNEIKEIFKNEDSLKNISLINSEKDICSVIYKIGLSGDRGQIPIENIKKLNEFIKNNQSLMEEKSVLILGSSLYHDIMLNQFLKLINKSIEKNVNIYYYL